MRSPESSVRGRGSTIYDVAASAGVSVSTVSRVMRGTAPVAASTREKVGEAMRSLRFVPNRLGVSLAEGRHAANGIVFPDLTGPYFADVLLGYEEAAGELGRSVIVLSTHGRDAAPVSVLGLASRVDGLVVLGRTVADEVVEQVVAGGTPVVTLARPTVALASGASTDTVCADNRSSAEELARHVLTHGARDVVLLGDPDDSPDVAERWAAFDAVLSPAARVRRVCSRGFDEAAGARAAAALLAEHRPDAVLAQNDEVALGVLTVAAERGLDVPGDLIVTGWDDVMAARWAGLTTVHQPMRDLGERAARLLDARITGATTPPQHEVLPTRVVHRRTCGPHQEDR